MRDIDPPSALLDAVEQKVLIGSPGKYVVDNPEVQRALRAFDPPYTPRAAVEQKVAVDNLLGKPPMRFFHA